MPRVPALALTTSWHLLLLAAGRDSGTMFLTLWNPRESQVPDTPARYYKSSGCVYVCMSVCVCVSVCLCSVGAKPLRDVSSQLLLQHPPHCISSTSPYHSDITISHTPQMITSSVRKVSSLPKQIRRGKRSNLNPGLFLILLLFWFLLD